MGAANPLAGRARSQHGLLSGPVGPGVRARIASRQGLGHRVAGCGVCLSRFCGNLLVGEYVPGALRLERTLKLCLPAPVSSW